MRRRLAATTRADRAPGTRAPAAVGGVLAVLALGGCAHASQGAVSCRQAARLPGLPAALRAQILRDARADPHCRVPTSVLTGVGD